MSEINDSQRGLIPTLVGHATGAGLAAGASITAISLAAPSVNCSVAISITNSVTVPIENCNVVANAALVWRLKRSGANLLVDLINNSAVSVDYSITLLGWP